MVNLQTKMRQIALLVTLLFFFTGCSFWGVFDFLKSKRTLEHSVNYSFKRSKPNREIREFKQKYRGKIVDTKAYLLPPQNGHIVEEYLSDIVKTIKKAGVDFVIFTPSSFEGYDKFYRVGVKQKIILKEMGKGKVGLFFGGSYISAWLHKSNILQNSPSELHDVVVKLSNDIKSGEFIGVGEVGVSVFEKDRKIFYPFDKKEFLSLVGMIVKKGLYLNLNAELISIDGRSYEVDVAKGIKLLYKKFPNIKLILSNNGMMSTKNIGNLLKKYSKLMISLRLTHQKRDWRYIEPILNSSGELYEDWANLLENYSSRFLIASSSEFGSKEFRMSIYAKEMRKYRHILGSIEKKAALDIAYGNAYRIFKIE